MGIDYYNCEICNEIFSDVGYCGFCGKCEAYLCGHCLDKMREKNGEIGEDHENAGDYGEDAPNGCDICDGSVIDEVSFINFLTEKIGKTRSELEEEYRNRNASASK
ncbi:hypothetical protein [Heyndrickxia sporothermodurans]|uniref:hypothetical protein n=1 Tax=Heyndrickxia sporothermodurans TaxID=46224 RepID=UPI002E1E75AF|nr:hypothetical protein [Heyndrickxia sporothermodurans]MED3697984.1 hypothetical protein [Heyndrickxia sporothermodurans]